VTVPMDMPPPVKDPGESVKVATEAGTIVRTEVSTKDPAEAEIVAVFAL